MLCDATRLLSVLCASGERKWISDDLPLRHASPPLSVGYAGPPPSVQFSESVVLRTSLCAMCYLICYAALNGGAKEKKARLSPSSMVVVVAWSGGPPCPCSYERRLWAVSRASSPSRRRQLDNNDHI